MKSRPPNTNIFFTSRRRNNIAGEIPYEIKDLKNNTGANLFVRYAKRYFQNGLTEEFKEKLKGISAKTEGHPLVLEILARIYRGSQDELDKMMLELGKVEITSKDGRHTSLEKSFRYSYRLLDANQQKALQHVIAFNSPFLIKATNMIFDIDDDTILEPYDRSLLRKYDISRTGKSEYNLYYFHQSIKSEIEKLQDTNFEKLYMQKFVEFYWDLLYQTYKLLSTSDVSLAISRFNVIYDGDKNDFDRSLEFANKNDSSYIAELLGLIVSGFGQYTKAIKYHEKSFVIKKEIDDIVGVAQNLIIIATSLIKLENNTKALLTAKQSKNILLELQKRIGQTIPLMNYVEQVISDLEK